MTDRDERLIKWGMRLALLCIAVAGIAEIIAIITGDSK